MLCASPSQPSLPGPLETTDLFPVSIVLPFPEFSDWLLSLQDDFFLNTAITTCSTQGPSEQAPTHMLELIPWGRRDVMLGKRVGTLRVICGARLCGETCL